MNPQQRILAAALLVAALGIVIAQQQNCCSWPITGHGETNVTINGFKCKEPITLKCARTATSIISVGIYGGNGGPVDEGSIISMGMDSVEETLVCGKSEKWTVNGQGQGAFQYFGCAYRMSNGQWVFDK